MPCTHACNQVHVRAALHACMHACMQSARLLEGVDLKDLEAEDVEQADKGHRVARVAADRVVDPRDDPVEEQAVHLLAEGVARGSAAWGGSNIP